MVRHFAKRIGAAVCQQCGRELVLQCANSVDFNPTERRTNMQKTVS